ncbi:MAG: Ig-like domain-containing protein [Candidatus Poribacteria bacterium]|nr:Ig-like domain-containing protein [Candidatus Poribacteria bacterium]
MTNSDGQAVTLSQAFSYDSAPTLTSLNPIGSTLTGGITVTLTGSGFLTGARVEFGANAATEVVVVSETQISATVPSGTAGTVDVKVTNTDGQAVTLSEAFTISPVNVVPAAEVQNLKVNEGETLAITLTAADPEGSSDLTYQVVDQPQNGLLSGTAPNLTYVSNPGFGGIDGFTFTVSDADQAKSPPTAVNITVNAAPVAEAQQLTTAQQQELPIVLIATDLEAVVLTYQIMDQPQNGTLSGTSPNLTYTPNPGFFGSDSFTFMADDGTLDSPPVTVDITVNASPVADSQEVIALSGAGLPLTLTASDDEADSLTYSIKDQSQNGNISGTGADIVYTSAAEYQGDDSFTFVVNDGFSDSLPATVTITVLANLPPVAETDRLTLPEDSPASKIDLLANDSDPEQDEITLTSVSPAKNGTVEQGQDSVVFYTPNENYFSSDQPDIFTYEISDGQGNNSQGLVEVFVEAVNDIPTAEGQQLTGKEDEAIQITLLTEDVDQDELTYQIVDPPFYGQLSGEGANLVYTPDRDYSGPDQFTFKVNDGTEESRLAQVQIELEAVFDPPAFATPADSLSGEYNTGGPINLPVTVENPEETDLSYQLRGLPEAAGAKLRTTRDGTAFSWLPTSEFGGTYSVTIAAISGENPPVNLTFELVIVPVNRSPIIQDLTPQLLGAGESLSVAVKAEDPDQGDKVEFTVDRLGGKGHLPTLGVVEINLDDETGTLATTRLEWTPDESDQGQLVEFRIRATDSQGAESQTTLSVGVNDVNTPPQLSIETGDRYNILETPAEGPVEGEEGLLIRFSATDLQQDTLQLSVLGLPKGAVLTTDQETNTGTITWLPDQKSGDGPPGFQLYSLQLVAEEVQPADKEPLTVKKPVRIRVQNLNSLPQLAAIDDLAVEEGETVSLFFSATDADQEAISFEAKGLPLGANLTDNGDGSAKFEWEVPFGFDTSQPVSVGIVAQDTEGQLENGVNRQSFQITVISVNRPPEQVGQLPKPRVLEGELVQFTIEFIDPDSGINPLETVELSLQSSVEEVELIATDGQAVIRWQTDANSGQDEAYQFEIIAADAAGAEAQAVVIVVVDNANQPPEFGEVELPEVLEGETIAVPLLASDPDNPQEPLLFQVGGDLPSGLALIAGRDLLIQPQLGQAGRYNLKLTVLDSEGAKARTKVQLVVGPQNLPPEIEPLQPIYNGVAGDPTPIAWPLLFSDPNDDALEVTVEGDLPAGYQLDQPNGSFSWQPTVDQFGDYQVTFTVREVETEEAYQTTVSTQITVLNLEGPILRDLQISGSSGYVSLSVRLEVEGNSLADVAFQVEAEEIYQQSQVSSGQLSYDWDTSALGLGEETQYKITAVAKVGESGNQISIGPVLIDNRGPEISFNTGLVEAGTGELLNLEAKVTDNDQVETVTFLFGTQLIEANPSSAGNYRASLVVPENPQSDLRAAGVDYTEMDGTIEFPFSIQATDWGGNTTFYPPGTALMARLVDKTLPAAKITPDKVIVKQGDTVRLSGGQSTDNSGMVSAYYWDLDDSDGVDFETSQYRNKHLEFTADRSSILTLQIRDAAGNAATAKAEIEVIDKTAPEPPIFGRIEVDGRQVEVDGQAEADATVILRFLAENVGTDEEWRTEVDENGFFALAGAIAEEGLYRLQAVAIDPAENISRPVTAAQEILIDLTPPELLIGLSQADGGLNETNNLRPPITVEVLDRGGLGQTQLSLFEGATPVSIEGGSNRQGQSQKNLLLTVIPLRPLIDGVTYTVQVAAEDVAGNKTELSYQFKINLALADISPPQIRILSPPTEGMLMGSRRPFLKASIQDLGGFDLSANPVSVNLTSAGQEIRLKGVSLTGDINDTQLTAFPVEELPPAEYMLSIRAQDRNGNQQSASRTFTIIGPPVAGSLNRAQSEAEHKWVSAPSTVIAGQLDMALLPGGGSVEIYRNDQFQMKVNIDAGSGSFTAELPLLEGENRVDTLPVNIVGLKGQLIPMGTFVVDTQKPIIDSLQPANGAVLPTFNELRAVVKDSTIVSTMASGIDANSIDLTVDGKPVTDFSYDPTSGLLTYQPAVSQTEAKEYVAVLKVSDQLGHSSQTEVKFQVDPDEDDTVAPTIAGLFPAAGQTINAQQLDNLTIRATVYDVGSELAKVQVRLDGLVVNLASTEHADGSLASQNIILIQPDQLAEGQHLLTVYAQDKSGNQQVVNADFVVDTEATTPSIQSLSRFVNQTSIAVHGQGEAGAEINLFVNGQPAQSAVVDQQGTFAVDSVGLTEGQNEIYLVAVDVAGNQSQRSTAATVLVDLQPPTVGNPMPRDGQRTPSPWPEMKVELADNPGGSGIDEDSLQFILDGNQPLSEFVYQADSGRLSYLPTENSAEVSGLAEGSHTFRLIASDLAGNQTILESGQFFVDTTAPEISHLLPTEGQTLTSPRVKIQALIQSPDVDQVSVQLKSSELGTQMELKPNFDPISGKLLAQVESDLLAGDYVVAVSVADVAGNISQQEINFQLDLAASDNQPPIIRPQFPQPGQEISTVSMMAIKFEALDADSEIKFEEMVVEINGVVYNNLFKAGSKNRYNRQTGAVVLFGRLQQESADRELADVSELGVLDRPLDLSLGTNTISIAVSDAFQNLTSFEFSFAVSLTPAASPSQLQLVTDDPVQLTHEQELVADNLGLVVTEYQGMVYTNATQIPLSGQIAELEEGRQVEVEVLVNGNSMGHSPVDNTGSFKLNRLVLKPGLNAVTAFSRTASQLQSPATIPLQVFVDQQPPEVSFVDLPTYLSRAEAEISLRFVDNSQAPARAMTLLVNDQPQSVSIDQSTVTLTIQLQNGDNWLALSAVDLAGNVSQPQERRLIVDSSPPATTPSQLKGTLSATGNQLKLDWQADANAQTYHLYRSIQPITEVGDLKPRAENLTDTRFVDLEVDLAQTYYYAVTSVSPAGVESLVVSENLNLTIISDQGGTAATGDGSRITFGSAGLSTDPSLRLAVSVEVAPISETPLPPLNQDQALANSDRQFKAVSQNGQPFTETLSQMAAVSISYPTGEIAESIRVYALMGDHWQQVNGVSINPNQQTLQFKTDRLTRFRLAIPPSKPWDPNRDGRVDILDLVAVANDFGQSIYDNLNSVGSSFGQTGVSLNLEHDLNGDGQVDILDLVAMGKQTFQPDIYADLSQLGHEFGQTDGLMSNDVNEDGKVDIFDLVSAARTRKPKLIGDINEDGYVDVFDLALIAIHFGEQYPSDQPVSAPALVRGSTQGWVALKPQVEDNSPLVNVYLSSQLTETLKGYQFSVSYDPALLSVRQIEEGNALGEDSFSFEPPGLKAGTAKFATVDLSRSKPIMNQLGQEMTLAKLVVEIHGDRAEALSSLRLEEIVLSNPKGKSIAIVSQLAEAKEAKHHFELSQNYPNPFNPETWIPYHLSVDSQVEITIYEATGQQVRRLKVGWQTAGNYQGQDRAAYWDGRNKLGEPVASGVYFYTIQAGDFSDTRKMLLMK